MKKSFGQHFLHDKGVIQRIVDTLDIGDGQVVEIGPGAGALTQVLVQRMPAQRLTLIEADRDLVPNLVEQFPGVTIVQGDAAKTDIQATDWVLIANLPYNAAAAILKNAFVRPNPPKQAVIMVQKEQADRMRAPVGEMSLLSVFIQLYTSPKKVFDVGSGAFTPAPNVESTVLKLTTLPGNWEENESVLALAKAGFSSRRKQLHKNLAAQGVATSDEVKQQLRAIGLPETARAQELSVDQWRDLRNALGA